MSRQSGFSLVYVVVLLFVLVAISAVGYYVWSTNDEERSARSSNQSSSPSVASQEKNDGATAKKAENEAVALPSGWKWYEDKSIGFKFAYPAVWPSSEPVVGLKSKFSIPKEVEGGFPTYVSSKDSWELVVDGQVLQYQQPTKFTGGSPPVAIYKVQYGDGFCDKGYAVFAFKERMIAKEFTTACDKAVADPAVAEYLPETLDKDLQQMTQYVLPL